MKDKLKYDSTATFKPIIYQFIIALEKCFEMVKGESVYIEKYGDVTVSDNLQIEVKDYNKDLTDSHENIWKTLNNWLDDSFDSTYYKNLILLTTQGFGKKSSLVGWNSKGISEKRQILEEIYVDYQKKTCKSEATIKLFTTVLSSDKKEKLNEVLSKFLIFDSSECDEVLYEKLKQKHAKVLRINQDNFINSLLGFIISPPITSSGWEITYDEFSEKVFSLVEEYAVTTKIFPKKYLNYKVERAEESLYADYLFVRKIREIEYPEVIGDAITDFVNTRKTINEELSQHRIGIKHYDIYEKELHRSYSSKYRTASRKSKVSTLISDSQDLYDLVTDYPVPNFRNFNDTPVNFRNGLLHEMANSNNVERKVVWKLNVKDE